MKTDLTKILSISGQHGLFRYLAQARSGAVVESLQTGKRMVADVRSRITTLEDISIFTEEGEMKLREVFLKLKDVLGEENAPDSKAAPEALKDLFAKAVPNYDDTRFYVSHMKKVVDWYNDLKANATLDFVDPEEEGEGAGEAGEEAPEGGDAANA